MEAEEVSVFTRETNAHKLLYLKRSEGKTDKTRATLSTVRVKCSKLTSEGQLIRGGVGWVLQQWDP